MAFIYDTAFDAALSNIITNVTTLHICTAEPVNYAGIAALELANAPVTLTGPVNGDVSGRKATIPNIIDDDVDTSGTATHWALSNGTDTLVASGSLASSVALSSDGTYSFAATDIEIPDAVDE